MRKSLFFVAAAALALVSCNNDVTLSENTALAGSNAQKEIKFTPFAQSPKRAAGITNSKHGFINGTEFSTDWGMTVSAYDVTNSREFFGGTNFKYNYAGGTAGATHGYWGGEEGKARYWPLSATQINFLAIAHANENNSTDVEWTTNNTPTQQVVVEMSDNYDWDDAQRDFLYAIGAGEVTSSGNALTFPDKVAMTFKHTQAYLVFKAKAADAASEAITITDIKIKGARTSGTATIARTAPGTYNSTGVSLQWADCDYPNDGEATDLNSVTKEQTAIDSALLAARYKEIGHLLVVPNMNDAFTGANEGVYQNGFTSFEISYTLDSKPYTYVYTPASTVLMAGKKYIYNITFKLHEIFIKPEVTDWTEVDDYAVIVPDATVDKDAAPCDVTVGNAAGKYLIEVTDLTPGDAASVAVTTTGDDFITGVALQGNKVGASGNVVIELTKSATVNDKSETITLSIGTTPTNYVLTIKTPVTL